jgi:hypothetical protein
VESIIHILDKLEEKIPSLNDMVDELLYSDSNRFQKLTNSDHNI